MWSSARDPVAAAPTRAPASVVTSTIGDGTEEKQNYASTAYTAGASYYVDDSIADGASTAHFDDILSRPALLTVINKAALGPRSH